jgi:hypothetical protein
VKQYCPNCGTPLEVEPELAEMEVYSVSTLIVHWVNTTVQHTCPSRPDPTRDEVPRCGAQRGDGFACTRDREHPGKHGYAGIFWTDDPPHLTNGLVYRELEGH